MVSVLSFHIGCSDYFGVILVIVVLTVAGLHSTRTW